VVGKGERKGGIHGVEAGEGWEKEVGTGKKGKGTGERGGGRGKGMWEGEKGGVGYIYNGQITAAPEWLLPPAPPGGWLTKLKTINPGCLQPYRFPVGRDLCLLWSTCH
jgi:hypothetical protein